MKIACDEAGHTGPDLLSVEQRYFAYASVAIEDDEAFEIIRAAREKHPVQMPELKGAQLMKSAKGRRLVGEVLEHVEGRFAVSANDKLLALCGWFFEYIYEPVLQSDPTVFYQKNFHRFIAMFAYVWFLDGASEAAEVLAQFQKYMRTKDVSDASLLFERSFPLLTENDTGEPFELILRFSSGYKDTIAADNATLSEELANNGKWALDLSASALWSHLNHWGQKGEPLDVVCDVSKPLQSIVSAFTGDERDPAIRRARQMGIEAPLGWTFAKPVQFVDSRNHPAVQIADLIASASISLRTHGLPEGFRGHAEIIDGGALRDSIFPDPEVIDLNQRAPAVNYLMLYELANRAERGGDPVAGIAEFYRVAEIGWVEGDFNR